MQKPEFVYVTYIRTTREKLWQALTQPDQTRQFWGGLANHSDWNPGSKWEHLCAAENNDVYIFGEVRESIPYRRLVMSWIDPKNTADESLLTLEIEPFDDLVRLKVIHGDFKDGSSMQGKISNGWPVVLSSLKTYLETGKGINIRAAGTCGDGTAQT